MISLNTHTKEEFEVEYIARRKKMRSIANRQLLSVLYTNALEGNNTDATELARLLATTNDDIHKKVSNLNTIHGVRVLNQTGKLHKSSYKLVGFFKPRKRNRKKVAKAPVMMFQLSKNDQLLNQVFC